MAAIGTYPEVFVRCLLVFSVHGAGGRTSEGAQCGEDGQADQDADGSTQSNLAVLIGGSTSSGTVGTEGNPVGYRMKASVSRGSIDNVPSARAADSFNARACELLPCASGRLRVHSNRAEGHDW